MEKKVSTQKQKTRVNAFSVHLHPSPPNPGTDDDNYRRCWVREIKYQTMVVAQTCLSGGHEPVGIFLFLHHHRSPFARRSLFDHDDKQNYLPIHRK